jgi:hypothetical protein
MWMLDLSLGAVDVQIRSPEDGRYPPVRKGRGK